jgi:hypothetical protein
MEAQENFMHKVSMAAVAAALLAIAPFTTVTALPILSDPLSGVGRTGYGVDFEDDVLGMYDAGTDRLRMSSRRENARFRGPGSVELFEFDSYFELSAGVDESGRVIDRGTMRWEGDFGSGRELLATGKLIDLGFVSPEHRPDVSPDPNEPNIFSFMRLLLRIDFLDTRVEGMGNHFGFFYEQQWLTPFASPFEQDWLCPTGTGVGLRCRGPES